jgi:hypothetical protein
MARIDVQHINSAQGVVLFDDGVEGHITNWVIPGGEVFDTFQPEAISVVAYHPGPNVRSRWFAIALGEFEAVIH